MKKLSKLPPLNELKWVHLVGACGTLMGSFAAFLKRNGVHVTGSDQNIYPPMSDVLRDSGIELFQGYRKENLDLSKGKPDLVIIGNVISSGNPEAQAVIENNLSYSSLPEAMERLLLSQTRNLVVAGTHGKTTTSSMLAHVLKECGQDPNYFMGGVAHDLPHSFHITNLDSGHLFVLEGDEYDTAFWDKVPKFNHYLPDDVILTSVEFDHADIYPDFSAVKKAFSGLVSRIRPGGCMIACVDYPAVVELLSQAQVPVLSYGITSSQAQYQLKNGVVHEATTEFEIWERAEKKCEVTIQLPGIYNALNAMAVWIECQQLKLDSLDVVAALRSFRGVKRRQELRATLNDILVIDDFAHHPTAVRETLRALRLKYPDRKLTALFEPRSATSRRKIFQQEYALAFSEADRIWIATPFDQTKIAEADHFSSETLVNDLRKRGKESYLMTSVQTGIADVLDLTRPGDVLAVLSNGGFGGAIELLIEGLKKKASI